jgi:hypothetical protein
MKLKDALPEFYDELTDLFGERSPDLLPQLPHLEITSRCSCGQFDCSTFYVSGGESPLSLEEQSERGRYRTSSIDLDAENGLVVVDLDHLRRIKSFEILKRNDVDEKLKKLLGC